MVVATFNANSVRARLDILCDWLAEHQVDVLGIQEIKCENDQFPTEEFEALGYNVAVHGQKSYSGVALLTKSNMTAVARGFGDPAFDHESRLIAATVDGVRIINTYVPNGNKVGNEKWQFKMAWLDRFADYIASEISRGDVIWMGDINIAREPRDVYDSAKVLGGVGHHPDEFSRLDTITDDRLVDVFRKFHEEGGHYTYWDFFIKNAVDRKLGWRIDHIYATQNLAEKCLSCEIDLAPRKLERPSDHTFVVAEFT